MTLLEIEVAPLSAVGWLPENQMRKAKYLCTKNLFEVSKASGNLLTHHGLITQKCYVRGGKTP